MGDWAVVPAAGGFKGFGQPRAVLPLNGETFIERLLRQIRKEGIKPLVLIGKVGEVGWTEAHVEYFRRLPYWKIQMTSPHSTEDSPLKTILFGLRHLLENAEEYKIKKEDKIFVIYADWVFTDDLFKETVQYPAPCHYCHKKGDPGFILNFEVLPAYFKFIKDFRAPCHAPLEGYEKLGFKCNLGSMGNFNKSFAEVDLDFQYQECKDLLK